LALAARAPKEPSDIANPAIATHLIDGFRLMCRRDGDRVSRRGRDWTRRVPRIADALLALPVKSVVLDGEGVVCGWRSDLSARLPHRLERHRRDAARSPLPLSPIHRCTLCQRESGHNAQELFGYAVLTDWKRQGSAIKIAEAAATAAPPKAVPIIRSLG
jgi:hypothetical protein